MSVGVLLGDISELLRLGGPVLWMLLALCFFMWLLILERFLFVWRVYPHSADQIVEQWKGFCHIEGWKGHSVRASLISESRMSLVRNLSMIKLCIALCPMLGLLGTVVGMMSVFDTIGVFGTSDSRALSAGISMATIPTVVGIVVALSGYYFHIKLVAISREKTLGLADRMVGNA